MRFPANGDAYLGENIFLTFSRISRRLEISSPNLPHWFNSSAVAIAQKTLNPIRHICGPGASVGYERASEYSTRRDENHKYGVLDSMSSSIVFLVN